MNVLVKILAHKLFAFTVLVGVGIWFLVIPAFTGRLGANPLEALLHESGEIAIWTLGAVLALSPLRGVFMVFSILARTFYMKADGMAWSAAYRNHLFGLGQRG